MRAYTTITISVPVEMSREIKKVAAEEQRTMSELIRESFSQYSAQRHFRLLVKKGKAIVKKKGLKPEDFGGPFEG
jgi:predicted transcriptional regulator